MNTPHTPTGVAPPFGHYCHAMQLPADAERLVISGQVGVMPDGTLGADIGQQAEWAWRNIVTILREASMDITNIVKYTTYLIRAQHVAAARNARNKALGDHRAASTLVVISALADPAWLIEIEAEAAISR